MSSTGTRVLLSAGTAPMAIRTEPGSSAGAHLSLYARILRDDAARCPQRLHDNVSSLIVKEVSGKMKSEHAAQIALLYSSKQLQESTASRATPCWPLLTILSSSKDRDSLKAGTSSDRCSRAAPPPGTMPSSTAAKVAFFASSIRSFLSSSSASVAAPTCGGVMGVTMMPQLSSG